jgi:hypothetical protein
MWSSPVYGDIGSPDFRVDVRMGRTVRAMSSDSKETIRPAIGKDDEGEITPKAVKVGYAGIRGARISSRR